MHDVPTTVRGRLVPRPCARRRLALAGRRATLGAAVAALTMLAAGPRGAHGQATAPESVTAPGVEATRPAPLQRAVTLKLADVPLATAVKAIDEQAELGLAYTARTLPEEHRVSIDVRGVRAEEALRRVLAGTGVVVRRTATGLLMLVREEPTSATAPVELTTARPAQREGAIVGVVTDSSTARPLGGATITLLASGPDTALTTVTRDDGFFALPAPAGEQRIQVRHVGYRPVERTLVVRDTQVTHVSVAMQMRLSRLQEMVVTATGQRRRMDVGNDVVVINADSIVRAEAVTSVADLLEGRVPGLVAQRSSGAPGDPTRLRLRGVSSVYLSNDPIVIVDGVRIYSEQSDVRGINLATSWNRAGSPSTSEYAVPSPLDYLDPNSIATIEVLKGPSAATLYGVDAANGVIVITTKQGRAGPARWSSSVEHGVTYMPSAYPDSYLRWGHAISNDLPIQCPVSATHCVADSLARFQILNDDRISPIDDGYRTAATVGVDGGSETLRYAVNASFSTETGLLRLPALEAARYRASHGDDVPAWMRRPQRHDTWGVTSRISGRLGARADVSLSSILSRSDQQRSSMERQLDALRTTYVDPVSGAYYQLGSGGMSVLPAGMTDYYTRVTAQATTFTNGLNLTLRPTGWLTVSADAGLNLIQREDAAYLPRGASLATIDSVGTASAASGTSTFTTLNLRGTATMPTARGWRVRASAGVNYTGRRTSDVAMRGSDLEPGASSLGRARFIHDVLDQDASSATIGFYVEPEVGYRHLTVSTGLRLDGGSTSGDRNRLSGLPRINASWLVSEESFFPLGDVFSTLRLRAAYGHAGVQPYPGDKHRLYQRPQSTWADGTYRPGTIIMGLGNPELRPERSTEFEGGVDADLLDDRLTFSVTGYRKVQRDALMYVPVAPSVYGGGDILRNIGTVENQGLELSIGMQPIRGDWLSLRSDLQLSHNRNRVVSLGRGVRPFGGNTSRVVAGYPLGGRWGIPVISYADVNGDGILAVEEVLRGDTAVYLGSGMPDYTAGLHSTLSLFRGRVSVRAGLAYSDGLTQVASWSNSRTAMRAYNDPTASLAEQAAAMAMASEFVDDYLNTQTVSELRLSSLTLDYRVPAAVSRRFGASSMSIALQGTNLGLRSNYRGIDPNVNGLVRGNGVQDGGGLPQPRSWQLRISASH